MFNILKCKYCGKNSLAKNAIFCSKKCDTYYSEELTRKNNSNFVRVTISMDGTISKSLRDLQSRLILNANESISFSQVVNLVLGEGIKTKKMVLKGI